MAEKINSENPHSMVNIGKIIFSALGYCVSLEAYFLQIKVINNLVMARTVPIGQELMEK